MQLVSYIQQRQLISRIDRLREYRETSIVFIDGDRKQVIRDSTRGAQRAQWIVIERLAIPTTVRESNVGERFEEMIIDCAPIALSLGAIAVGFGAAPLTAGTSTMLSAVGKVGAAASAGQCIYAATRLGIETSRPEYNDWIDSVVWFQRIERLLMLASLGGAFATGFDAVKALLRAQKLSGRPMKELLKAMPRAQRQQLAKDLARYSGQAPTRRQFFRLAKRRLVPKIYSVSQVRMAVAKQLLEAVGSGFELSVAAKESACKLIVTISNSN